MLGYLKRFYAGPARANAGAFRRIFDTRPTAGAITGVRPDSSAAPSVPLTSITLIQLIKFRHNRDGRADGARRVATSALTRGEEPGRLVVAIALDQQER